MKTIEKQHIRVVEGSRVVSSIKEVTHDWDTQCAWVYEDGSHCQYQKKDGSQMCEGHGTVVG